MEKDDNVAASGNISNAKVEEKLGACSSLEKDQNSSGGRNQTDVNMDLPILDIENLKIEVDDVECLSKTLLKLDVKKKPPGNYFACTKNSRLINRHKNSSAVKERLKMINWKDSGRSSSYRRTTEMDFKMKRCGPMTKMNILKCHRCVFSTFHPTILKNHFKNFHLNFKCGLCRFKTVSKLKLDSHIELVHKKSEKA